MKRNKKQHKATTTRSGVVCSLSPHTPFFLQKSSTLVFTSREQIRRKQGTLEYKQGAAAFLAPKAA